MALFGFNVEISCENDQLRKEIVFLLLVFFSSSQPRTVDYFPSDGDQVELKLSRQCLNAHEVFGFFKN